MIKNSFSPYLTNKHSFALFSLLACGLLLASATQAATITVNSASDALNPDHGCTLRGAIDSINQGTNTNGCTASGSYGNNDEINFSLPSQTTTIIFNSEIPINKNLAIYGDEKVKLDGNKASRILNVAGGTALTISGLTFMNGNAQFNNRLGTGQGGAIFSNVEGHTMTIERSVFLNNNAGRDGGAVFSFTTNATVKVRYSAFNGNQAMFGGAIAAASIDVDHSFFIENSALNNGGALLALNHVTVSNSQFSGNNPRTTQSQNDGYGGAILSMTATISGSIFDNNYTGMSGGAIYVFRGISVSDSIFVNNTFGDIDGNGGGAIFTAGNAIINSSTFSHNGLPPSSYSCGSGHGGAINAIYTSATIINSTFIDNLTPNGGAISSGNLTAHHLTLVNNNACGGSAIEGYGVLNNSLIADDTTIYPMQCVGWFSGGKNIEWHNGQNENTCNSTSPVLVPAGISLAQLVSSTLADNGGQTPTLALPAGSPAIDAGDPAVAMTTDQRGQARPQGSGPDLGAFETGPQSSGSATHVDITTQVVNGVTLTTINGQLVSYPEHVGMNTAVFVFTNIVGTDNWLLLNPETGWHPWVDCANSVFPYSFGTMPWVTDIALFYNGDLSPFQGWPVLFGYGVGDTKETACADMLNNARYTHVTTL